MSEIRWEEFQDAVEYGGTLRFSGSNREISEQVLLASAVLRDRAYSGGQVGIDYETLLGVPVQTSGGEGFGGWLMTALPVLIKLREAVYEAVLDCEPWKARAWLAVRRPLPEKVTEREFSHQTHIPKTTVHRALVEVDSRLAEVLRDRAYIIRG